MSDLALRPEPLQSFEHGGDQVVGDVGEGEADKALLAGTEHVARNGEQVLLVGKSLGYIRRALTREGMFDIGEIGADADQTPAIGTLQAVAQPPTRRL